MNKRIKQLAEQAGFEITPWGNESVPCVHQEGPIDVELEKFAELIVKECIGVVNKRYMGDNNREDMEVRRCIADLKKHFGVE